MSASGSPARKTNAPPADQTSTISADEIAYQGILREGKNSVYHRAVCRSQEVMAKVIQQPMDSHTLKKLRRQVGMLQKIRHPNVLLYMGCCQTETKLVIISELVEMNLATYLLDSKVPLSMSRRLQMARDCALGLNWMHGCDPPVVHGDICPKHFYLDGNQRVKICEFGWDRDLDPKHVYDPRFTSPEVLKGHTPTAKSDIFSFGMLLLFIVTRAYPYSTEHPVLDDLRSYLLSHPNTTPSVDNLPSNVARLVTACLMMKQTDRPNMRQILKVTDVIMIDTSIADPSGKKFWRKHFFQMDEVLWNEISSTLWQVYLPTHVIVDTSSQNLLLKQQIQQKLLYFRAALVQMAPAPAGGDHRIFMENVGFVLQYFGPLIDSSNQALPFLTRVFETLSEDWFFGTLDLITTCTRLSQERRGTFLVRYSSTSPGYFTISTKCGDGITDNDFAHYRIQHEPLSEIFTILGRSYPSLTLLISAEKQTLSLTMPCPGSPYALLRKEEGISSLGYLN